MDEPHSERPPPSTNEINVPGDEQSLAQGEGQVCEPQHEQEPVEPPAELDAVEKSLTQSEWRKLNRRELLKLTPILIAGAFVIPGLRTPLLREGVALSDWASGLLFSKARFALTFAPSAVVPFEKFPYNGYDVLDPNVDLDNWTLKVEGKVRRAGEYTLAQIRDLPKITQNVRHVCVEGWDAIGSFGGVRISDFLRLVGADSRARFLEVACADDYYESVDMDTAMHPQSLLCYEMYGKPLDRGHGAPLRLHFPTKLGYKHAKYLTALRVTDVLKPKRGYWVDQGYSWFAGL
jgi:DMSO/TMAO reductase YedYZ molybdopterin-dependent catalytic subunit